MITLSPISVSAIITESMIFEFLPIFTPENITECFISPSTRQPLSIRVFCTLESFSKYEGVYIPCLVFTLQDLSNKSSSLFSDSKSM